MVKIVKNKNISNRPVFENEGEEKASAISIFSQNRLLKKLAPHKHISTTALFFRKFSKNIREFFTVQHPDELKENLASLMRPLPSQLTIGNLWKHYAQYLKEDKACPKGIASSFHRMEKDEQAILKLHRFEENETDEALAKKAADEKAKLIKKTKKSLEHLKEGKTRLFLLNRSSSLDQSLSGDLFCSITRTNLGYTLHFLGSGEQMQALQEGLVLPLSGKDKVPCSLTYADIPKEELSHFFETLINSWVEPEGVENVELLRTLSTHQPVEATSLDQYMSVSSRTDKVFWNLIGTLADPEHHTSRLSTRSIALRAELLTLYESFDQALITLKPGTKDYHDLNVLFTNVSKKVLLHYRKGYLSEEDFEEIQKRLGYIDKALKKAKQLPPKLIPSKVSLDPHGFERVSLKKAKIAQALETTGSFKEAAKADLAIGTAVFTEALVLPPLTSEVIALKMESYSSIQSPEEFLQVLQGLHRSRASLETGSEEEKRWAQNELFRFFKEVPFRKLVKHNNKNPDAFWWQFTSDQAGLAIQQIAELTESLALSKKPVTVSQYDWEAISKMRNILLTLNAHRTGMHVGLDYAFKRADDSHMRKHSRKHPHEKFPLAQLIKLFPQHYTRSGHTGLEPTFKDKNTKKHYTLPKETTEWAYRQHFAIQKMFGQELHSGYSWMPHIQVNVRETWTRPISNPYLKAMFRHLTPSVGMREGLEYFHVDAIEALHSYLWPSASVSDPLEIAGEADLKALSRIFRIDDPHTEFAAFIKEQLHLFDNPEIRNLFDALFFSITFSSKDTGFKPKFFIRIIRSAIQESHKNVLKALEKDPVENPLALVAAFDKMLYFHEMLIRLRQNNHSLGEAIDDFPNLEASIESLLNIANSHPDLQASYGYAARLKLRMQLESKKIEPNQLVAILDSYAAIKSSTIDPYNVEPQFEQEMELHWQLIAKKLKEEPLDPEVLQPLFERLTLSKFGKKSDSPWILTEDLIFQSGTFQVDLKNWTVTNQEIPFLLGRLPQAIALNPFIQRNLPEENFIELKVLTERVGGVKVHSFQDKEGTQVRIEERDGRYALYKQIELNGTQKWLQCLDSRPNIKKDDGLLAAYADFKKEIREIYQGQPNISFFKQGIYLDPEKPKTGYVLDSKTQKPLFEVKLRQQGDNLTFEKIWDYRKLPHSGPWQLHNAALLEDKSLDFLKRIENQNEILLWSKKGSLKKVELPRYGLIFAVEEGRLRCETTPFKGYFVDPAASTGSFSQALALIHPDPEQPKKLLLADSSALTSTSLPLLAKAHGFGVISLFFHYLGVVSDMLSGIPPSIVSREETRWNPNAEVLHFTAVDLRPITGEICKTKSDWPLNVLSLIQHTLFDKAPHEAKKWMHQFPINACLHNRKLLSKLMTFLMQPSSDGATQAVKVHLALRLHRLFKENPRLPSEYRIKLNETILLQAKALFASGRAVPEALALSKNERLQLAAIMKKRDLAYYQAHFATDAIAIGESFEMGVVNDDPLGEEIKALKAEAPILSADERIRKLETEKVDPNFKIPEAELSRSIPRLDHPISLLFKPNELEKLFQDKADEIPRILLKRKSDEAPFEKAALDKFQEDLDIYRDKASLPRPQLIKRSNRALKKFGKEQLAPKAVHFEKRMRELKSQIENAVSKEADLEARVALYAKETTIASFDDLRRAWIDGTLETLKEEGKIAATCDLVQLKQQLFDYYEAYSKRNAAKLAQNELNKLMALHAKDVKNIKLVSDDLYRILTIERKYDPAACPRLLVFEAEVGKNLKQLSGDLNQLDLLESLLKDPNTVMQAPTGAGKTSVLSVLESLLKVTGKNLVIQKVLPPLFNQTLEQTEAVLGDLYQSHVLPLRFNFSMPLSTQEYYKEAGEEKQRSVSIFKGMYEDLLELIIHKGCLVSDYTSLPMMEAKFLQLGQKYENNDLIDPLDREHHTYLRKILLLLRNRGLESMDEFDQPNRPNQKMQLDLQIGANDIPAFYHETALEIYDLLAKDPELNLTQNLLTDISKATRQAAMEKAAQEYAKDLAKKAGNEGLSSQIEDYFLGKNEDILGNLEGVDPAIKDKISFAMKEFTLYLKLALVKKAGSDYARSDDEKRTVPCANGEKHENSKKGTLEEQINITIQDYLQTGVKGYDLISWFQEFHAHYEKAEDAVKQSLEAEFAGIFPDHTVGEFSHLLAHPQKRQPFIDYINQDPEKVRKFLVYRLKKLKTSGYLISINPVNMGDMTRATSGISATSGAPDSLHKKFKQDPDTVGQIKASMAYRMWDQAKDPHTILPYDPSRPETLLTQAAYEAIIDGAGAFNDRHAEAAQTLLDSNPKLKQVGYHDTEDQLLYKGVATSSLGETGFHFKKAKTRGIDITLGRNAHALLTMNENETFNDLLQRRGRLRGAGQTFQIAMPQEQLFSDLDEVASQTCYATALEEAKDIYSHFAQEIPGSLRNKLLIQLLDCDTMESYIDKFKTCKDIFVSKPEADHQVPGSYFTAHCHIVLENTPPEKVLDGIKEITKEKAREFNVILEDSLYAEKLEKMLPLVNGISADLECELQVEINQEVEAEVETELELEINQEQETEGLSFGMSDKIRYPARKMSSQKASIQKKIHPGYHPALFVTEAYLPFERNKTPSPFRRLPFKDSMYRVGEILFKVQAGNIISATIEDPLRDAKMIADNAGFIYDIRSRSIVQRTDEIPPLGDNFYRFVAQAMFFDGRISGYSVEEENALKAWLIEAGPVEMKRHLLDQVLRYRDLEQNHFEMSQLGQLFKTLI